MYNLCADLIFYSIMKLTVTIKLTFKTHSLNFEHGLYVLYLHINSAALK